MDTNKMRDPVREQFEAKFQTPNGMVWCNVAKQYVKALGCICPETAIAAHNQLWKCWQASREAVVVELPEPHMQVSYTDPQVLFAQEVREAIEAQGLKVTP